MEELAPLLNELALQLGTTVEFLWGVLLRQAQVEVIKGITYWIILIVLITVALKKVNFDFSEPVENEDFPSFLFAGILITTFIIALVMNVVNIDNILNALLNPEYWALQQILEVIK